MILAASLADDHMINQWHVDRSSGSHEASGGRPVCGRRGGVSGRMVVNGDTTGCIGSQGQAE
jgi:hypothetical protein